MTDETSQQDIPAIVLDEYNKAFAIVQRRAFPIVSSRQETELIHNAAQAHEMDILRSVVVHGATHPVQSIVLAVEALRRDSSYELSPWNVTPEHLEAAEEIMRATVEGMSGRKITDEQNEHLNKMSKHAISNLKDAPLVAAMIRDRRVCDYDQMLDLLSIIKESDNAVLAEGVL